MAEYITREAAMEIVKRTSGDYASAFAELRKLPAADVVSVVRCEDCANAADVLQGSIPGAVYCTHEIGGWVPNEHFCARGRRITNANEPAGT